MSNANLEVQHENIPVMANRLVAFAALFAFAYFAAPVLIPIAFAVYLNLVLSPLVRLCEKARIKPAVSSAFIVLSMVLLLVGSINILAEPAEEWFEKAPTIFNDVRKKITSVTEPLEDISELAETVEELTTLDTSNGVQPVVVQAPNLFAQLTDRLPDLVLSTAIVLFLTYFFLSAGDSFLRKLVALGRRFKHKRTIVLIFRQIQHEVSNYLLTITLVNVGLGICVFLVMYYLDVPNALLWGSLAAIMNFIPYLGALAMALILTMVGMASFDAPAAMFVPVAAYTGLSVLEGNLITPSLLGRNLSLQPSVLFVMLIFWGWMWGVVGALLSIPITVVLNVVLQRLPQYRQVSTLLQR